MQPANVFEIHVTVKSDSDDFNSICKELNVKPLRLSLQNKSGEVIEQQVMTSSTFKGGDPLSEAERIVARLGDSVVRIKIESPPYYLGEPITKEYWESHIKVQTSVDIGYFVEKYDLYLSKNNHKQSTQIITLRGYNTKQEFLDKHESLILEMTKAGIDVDDKEVERVIYDTNFNHDFNWLDNE